jgi:hypothetical protein
VGDLPVSGILRRQLNFVNDWVDHWNNFWFKPVNPLPVCILRVLVGGMLLYTHCIWGIALEEFFGGTGWNDAAVISAVREGGGAPSFWWYVPPDSLLLVHWICHAVIVCYLVGLGGRVTAVAAWAVAVSYANRSALSNFGLDQILCILTLYLMIAPSTKYLSLDYVINRLWQRRDKNPARRLAAGNGLYRSSAANVTIRLIQVHLCIIYLWAGLGKLQGEAWWNGQAVWLALANQEYQSFDMTWLASYPRLLELLTHATIAWELSFAFLVWPRQTRAIMLMIGAGMHLGIGAFLGMWTFGLIMIFSYVAFVPAAMLWSKLRIFKARTVVPCKSSLYRHAADSSNPIVLDASSVCCAVAEVAGVLEGQGNDRTGVGMLDKPAERVPIVLVASGPKAVEQFIQLNQIDHDRVIATTSLREARSLIRVMPHSLCLRVSIKELPLQPGLNYLSVRVVKFNSKSSAAPREKARSVPK